MRVWCRTMADGDYASVNVATAALGFKSLGAEIEKYEKIQDALHWITRDDIVVDGVSQSRMVFEKYKVLKTTMDYPDSLLPFAGRKIWLDTIGNLRKNGPLALFVKPVQEKQFTGRVILAPHDWAPLINIPLNQKVYCSELIDIRSEYRVFVRNDSILDIRHYHGDYHYYVDTKFIDEAVVSFAKWKERPAACALDFAVTDDRRTVFLELNDGYSIGAYGLEPSVYARFLATRWAELMDVPDPYSMDQFVI